MSLIARIESELKAARLARDEDRRDALSLVLNALQATSSGGRVVIRTAGDKQRFMVAVRDDGEGMPAEVRERAFNPFFTTREAGTGLGLPIVRRIVERHGGSVEIASEPGQGTTVTLVFPAHRGG